MARLFGLIGNRADLAGRVLASEAEALRVRARPGLAARLGHRLLPGRRGAHAPPSDRRPRRDRRREDRRRRARRRPHRSRSHARRSARCAPRTRTRSATGSGSSRRPARVAAVRRDPRAPRRRASRSSCAAASAARPTPRSSSTCSSRSCTTPGASTTASVEPSRVRDALRSTRRRRRRHGGRGRRRAERRSTSSSRTARTSSRCIAAEQMGYRVFSGQERRRALIGDDLSSGARRPSSRRCTSCWSRATSTTTGRSRPSSPAASRAGRSCPIVRS